MRCGETWGNSAHRVESGAPGHVEEGGGSDCLALGERNNSPRQGHVHSPHSYSPALSCILSLLCQIDNRAQHPTKIMAHDIVENPAL